MLDNFPKVEQKKNKKKLEAAEMQLYRNILKSTYTGVNKQRGSLKKNDNKKKTNLYSKSADIPLTHNEVLIQINTRAGGEY